MPRNQRSKSSVIQDKLFITDLQGHNNSYICFSHPIISLHLYSVYNIGEQCFNTASGQTNPSFYIDALFQMGRFILVGTTIVFADFVID